jgi:cytochrome oxidase Cu insertion factor (SCO1/SenC/PrrC family)
MTVVRLLLPALALGLVVACARPAEETAAIPPGLEFVPPAPGSYELPPIEAAVDGAVVDADGTRRRLFDYLGDHYVVLSFVYSHCTDSEGCPLATGILEMVRDALENAPDLQPGVRLVTLSFDPVRDTPEVMRDYALHAGPDTLGPVWKARPWAFLTTPSAADVQPILDGFGQTIVPEIDELGKRTGDFSHVLKVYLIDRRKLVRNIYSTRFLHPAIVINDLRTLWMEDAR